MSGPSTLATSQPCWGCGALPADGAKFKACTACAQLKLIPCSFCSLECMKEHWPEHEEYHRKARKEAKMLQATVKDLVVPRVRNRDEYGAFCNQGVAHLQARDLQKAGKALRRAIRLEPERPEAYTSLANVLTTLGDEDGACRNYVLAESRYPEHDDAWASAISNAFNRLLHFPDLPRPNWWKDAELLQLSEEALAVRGEEAGPWHTMRANVLHPRSATQYREAARCFTRSAELYEGGGGMKIAKLHREDADHSRECMAAALKVVVDCPGAICWGCGAVPLGRSPFQACAKCKAEKISPPAVFCSRECQVAHWPRHKEWHSEQRVPMAD